MKKILLLLISIFVFSCSSSDDSDDSYPIQNDSFVGKWYFGDTVYKLTDGGDYIENASSCDLQTYYKFNSNGTAEIISYYETSTGCGQEEDNISQFIWTKINSSTYRLYSVENGGTESTSNENVVFENSNTMYWKDTFTGLTIEGDEFYERWSYFNK